MRSMSAVVSVAALLVSAGVALAQNPRQTIIVPPGQHGVTNANAQLAMSEYGPGNTFRYGAAINFTDGATSVNVTGAATSGAGGGLGFGGMLSNSSVFMQSSGGASPSLSIAWKPGANLGANDVAVMFLQTDLAGASGARGGEINDFSTLDRNAISQVTRVSGGLPFVNNRAQHAVAFTTAGVFMFRIENNGALTFIGGGSGSGTGVNTLREITIPYASLGISGLASLGTRIDWTMGLLNARLGFGNQFISNESLPATTGSGSLNTLNNPGTNGNNIFNTYNRFIPSPGAAALLGLGGLVASRRRRA